MITKGRQKIINNPLSFSNPKTEALDEALRMFLETFEEYANKNELTEGQISAFKKLIRDSYIEKYAVYFMENKLSDMDNYINKAFRLAFKRTFNINDKEDITRVFYYNNKHKMIRNELY